MKRYRIYIITGVLLLVLIIVASFLFFKDETENNISSGELQYSQELGWINWSHVNPASTIEAYQIFQDKNQQATDSFAFTYAQTMKVKLAGKWLVANFYETRNVKAHLTADEAKEAFLEIFLSVSSGFEKMQAKFPNSYPSSFREGDLMGDLISFHLTTSNLDSKLFKKNLTLSDKRESLGIYQKNGLRKQQWSNVKMMYAQTDNILSDLIWKIGISNKYSRKSTFGEKFYIE